jgi:hypothetical protein
MKSILLKNPSFGYSPRVFDSASKGEITNFSPDGKYLLWSGKRAADNSVQLFILWATRTSPSSPGTRHDCRRRCHPHPGHFGAVVCRWRLLGRIGDQLGLYHANKLQQFLMAKVRQKIPAFQNKDDITFDGLSKAGCKKLKVVASDVPRREGERSKPQDAGGGQAFRTARHSAVLQVPWAAIGFPRIVRTGYRPRDGYCF